ncbi:putative ribonuclease H-like domain-containing protein [Tanacetum coccineum]
MNVSPIPITRIYKDHPKDQIIGDINSATQTRRMTKIFEELAMMDVKSSFLYGTIEDEVYVCQPPGFEDPQFPDKVYKVEKALYGLHQAPRAWYETLSTYLLENGFKRGIIDKTLFIKKDKGDIMLVQVMQRDDGIFISQDKYVANILKKFDFVTMKTTSTPIENHKALLKDEEAKDVDVHLYRSLMYLTASRPDIMFVVCACARFQVTPKVSHLHDVKRIFRYLKGQPKLGLWYPRDSPFDLEAFFDSDYTGASLDRKSTKENGNEVVHKELGDRMERAASTASSFEAEQDSGSTVPVESHHTPTSAPSTSQPPTSPPSMQTTHVAEEAATMPHDSPLPRVHSLGSDEGSMTLHELMVLCTTLSKKVESLESDLKQTKLTYEDEGNLEDPSKQGRKIAQLDEDEFTTPEEVYTAEPDISTANVRVSTAGAEVSTASPKVKTVAESLVYIRRNATKRKDKGKAIMKEVEPIQKKTKLQLEKERLGYEEALRLQEQLDEEERQRIARVHEEANTFNAEKWDNIQA